MLCYMRRGLSALLQVKWGHISVAFNDTSEPATTSQLHIQGSHLTHQRTTPTCSHFTAVFPSNEPGSGFTAQPCMCAAAGEVVQVSVVDACRQVRLRGFVGQEYAWMVANTSISISLPSLKDCSGSAFRPASAELQLANRSTPLITLTLVPHFKMYCSMVCCRMVAKPASW